MVYIETEWLYISHRIHPNCLHYIFDEFEIELLEHNKKIAVNKIYFDLERTQNTRKSNTYNFEETMRSPFVHGTLKIQY